MGHPGSVRRLTVDTLRELAAALAEKAGVRREDAVVFGDVLAEAERHGVTTHGMSRVGIYLKRMELGLIDPRAELLVERQHGAVLKLDAQNGLGQVAAMRALEKLFPLAREHGVAVATVRRSQHFGALSYYTNYAAERGFVLLAMTTAEPAMAPAGGYEAFFGTNPIAAAFPREEAAAVSVDLATSGVARGKIIAAQRKGEAIPEGWALDVGGNPTTDAGEALKGSVLTMAGHKGYALALMVEMFAGLLSGAAVGSEIGSMYKDMDRPQNVGHFFCLFSLEAFGSRDVYEERVAAMVRALKANAKRPGVEEILLPGERSARKAAANDAGIELAAETVRELQEWCAKLGVEWPD